MTVPGNQRLYSKREKYSGRGRDSGWDKTDRGSEGTKEGRRKDVWDYANSGIGSQKGRRGRTLREGG